jgi:hypothetical protein
MVKCKSLIENFVKSLSPEIIEMTDERKITIDDAGAGTIDLYGRKFEVKYTSALQLQPDVGCPILQARACMHIYCNGCISCKIIYLIDFLLLGEGFFIIKGAFGTTYI